MNRPLVRRRNMNLRLYLQTERRLHLNWYDRSGSWSVKLQISSSSSCFLFFSMVSASFWTLLVSNNASGSKSPLLSEFARTTFAVAEDLPDLGSNLSLILQVSMLWVGAPFFKTALDWRKNVHGNPWCLNLLRSLEPLREILLVKQLVVVMESKLVKQICPMEDRLLHWADLWSTGYSLQSLDSWLVHLLYFGFAHHRDNVVELSLEKATWADTLDDH